MGTTLISCGRAAVLLLLSTCSSQQISTKMLTYSHSVNDTAKVAYSLISDNKDFSLPPREVESQFQIFMDDFIKEATAHGYTISPEDIDNVRSVKYVDEFTAPSSDGAIAVCRQVELTVKWGKGILEKSKILTYKEIEVVRSGSAHYTNNKPLLLKALLYHEYIHCLLNFGHLPSATVGLMNIRMPGLSAKNLEAHWDEFMDDTFEQLALCPKVSDETN
jgi:hypothetical protein